MANHENERGGTSSKLSRRNLIKGAIAAGGAAATLTASNNLGFNIRTA